MSRNYSSGGGMSLGGVLACIFVTLKLLDKIDWSWWWVLSPLWIGFGLFMLIYFTALLWMHYD